MRKLMLLLCMLLSFCVTGLAADADKSDVAPDYQAVLGGSHAVVE